MSEEKPWYVILLFIPKVKIKQALVDLQSENGCHVYACDYLQDDEKFAVQVRLRQRSLFLEGRWKEKWEEPDTLITNAPAAAGAKIQADWDRRHPNGALCGSDFCRCCQ